MRIGRERKSDEERKRDEKSERGRRRGRKWKRDEGRKTERKSKRKKAAVLKGIMKYVCKEAYVHANHNTNNKNFLISRKRKLFLFS